jgi:hypothetical protein
MFSSRVIFVKPPWRREIILRKLRQINVPTGPAAASRSLRRARERLPVRYSWSSSLVRSIVCYCAGLAKCAEALSVRNRLAVVGSSLTAVRRTRPFFSRSLDCVRTNIGLTCSIFASAVTGTPRPWSSFCKATTIIHCGPRTPRTSAQKFRTSSRFTATPQAGSLAISLIDAREVVSSARRSRFVGPEGATGRR